MEFSTNIVGLVPAAGRGSRFGKFAFSKELTPVPSRQDASPSQFGADHMVPVGGRILEMFAAANVRSAIMVVSAEKTDLVRQFANGHDYGLDLGYAVQVDRKHGMPAALDAAYAFLKDATVVFGMPDTYIDNVNAFRLLLDSHNANRADVTLGCFRTDRPSDFGMVDLDETGRITNVIDKPKETDLQVMWGIACWKSSFSDFLRTFLRRASPSVPTNRETTLSDVFLAALEEKMRIFGTAIPGHYYDLGTGPAYRAFLTNSTDGTGRR